MDERNAKRRSWIKNIAIIFLVILLILTFFSNTIMNHSLPEVAVQYAQSGSITTRVRGSGTVEANSMYELKIDETRTIADIGIKSGSAVNEGDVLFKLKEGESPDYSAAEKAYINAKIEYEAALLEMPKDFSSLAAAVEDAEYELEKARKNASGTAVFDVTEDEVEYEIDKLTDEKEYMNNRVTVFVGQLSENASKSDTYLYHNHTDAQITSELADAEATAASLKNVAYSAEDDLALIDSVIADATADKDDIEAQIKEITDKAGSGLSDDDPLKGDYRTLEDMITSHEVLKRDKQRTLDDLMIVMNEKAYDYQKAMSDLAKAQTELLAGNITEDEYKAAAEKLTSAAKAYNDAQTSYNRAYEDAQTAIEKSELELRRKREDIAAEESDYAESSVYRDELAALEIDLDTVNEKLRGYERDKKEAQKTLEAANKNHADANDKAMLLNIVSCERRIKVLDEEIEDKTELLEDIKNAGANSENSEERLKDAERALTEAKNAYSRAVTEYKNEQKIDDMRLEQQKKELDKLKEEYESLKSGSSTTEIVAPVSGVISAVNVKIGDEVQMNSILCTIQLVDRGYSVSFNVTNDQAKRIKVGDIAEPQYYWGGDDIEARVESVTSIQGDTQNRKVTLNITGGDVRLGSNMTFILGERSQNYDIVVPKSALHEDANGSFVLVVTSKSTPLGTRYTATRADVQVLVSDDNNAAVTGSLNSYEYIITTASSPVSSGMLVRLKES